MVGIIQPCCAAFASVAGYDHSINQTAPAGNDELARHCVTPGHENDLCLRVFSTETAMLGEPFALSAKTDHTSHLVVTNNFAPPLAAPEFSNSFDLYYSSPPPRIYLRTQRLLI